VSFASYLDGYDLGNNKLAVPASEQAAQFVATLPGMSWDAPMPVCGSPKASVPPSLAKLPRKVPVGFLPRAVGQKTG